MARACACAGEWLELPLRSHHYDAKFLGGAWIFDMLLRFARVESGRAAQIVATGVARRLWWCRCEERRRRALVSRCARVELGPRCDLGVCHHLGPAGVLMLR